MVSHVFRLYALFFILELVIKILFFYIEKIRIHFFNFKYFNIYIYTFFSFVNKYEIMKLSSPMTSLFGVLHSKKTSKVYIT